ncbi:hypothetical protein QCA50_016699 [Cerrena zonata]|uniref:CENP-V/GFA domain-containing protein n=1 Tax=Cerrena zonata TaxID=2478898 RepID=A0AAW0FF24_9APHY
MTSSNHILKGTCFCGSVSYALSAPPVLSAYCHCTNCQRLKGCPFVHTVHFDASAFRWTHAEPHYDHLHAYPIPDKPHKTRYRCKNCGACVASHNSTKDKWSIWGVHLERTSEGKIKDWNVVKPTAHIFYGTRILDIEDSLGKWEGYEGDSGRIR